MRIRWNGLWVLERKTGKTVDLEKILQEEWARSLSRSGRWIFIQDASGLCMIDRFCNLAVCPIRRFSAVPLSATCKESPGLQWLRDIVQKHLTGWDPQHINRFLRLDLEVPCDMSVINAIVWKLFRPMSLVEYSRLSQALCLTSEELNRVLGFARDVRGREGDLLKAVLKEEQKGKTMMGYALDLDSIEDAWDAMGIPWREPAERRERGC